MVSARHWNYSVMATSAGAWTLIVLGGLLVGLGGTVATLGWNLLSEHRYQKNLISTAKEEWKLNDQLICDAVEKAKRWNPNKDTETFSVMPYKAFRLNALMSSGILGDSRRLLRDAAQEYESAISNFNAKLNIVGRHVPGLYIRTELLLDPPDKMPLNESDLLALHFRTLRERHKEIGKLLEITSCSQP